MAEHSPTPWRVVHGPSRGLVILDAGGEAVAATLDPARQRSEADAAFIVEAVNGLADALAHADDCARAAVTEHSARARAVEDAQREANMRADRLRDLVRRLADALDTFAAIEDREIDLVREAREALGEGE